MQISEWKLAYDKTEPDKSIQGWESLMTLGNGYLRWQSVPVWADFSDVPVQNSLNVEAGLLNFMASEKQLDLPNPQLMRFIVNDALISFDAASIVDRRSFINLEQGTQSDRYTVRTAEGFVCISTTKYMDPVNFHAIGFEGTFSATFDGKLVIESLIDGSGLNSSQTSGTSEHRPIKVTHVSDRLLQAKSCDEDIEIALAAKTFVNGELIAQFASDIETSQKQVLEHTQLHFAANKPVQFEKIIEIATSEEVEKPAEIVRRDVNSLPLSSLKENNAQYWKDVWSMADIRLETDDPDLQRKIRLCIFRLHQLAEHSINQCLDDSVDPALIGKNDILPCYYYSSIWPEAAHDVLRTCLSRNNPTNRDTSLEVAHNLWIYGQFTDDSSLLNEGGLEFLLENVKRWLLDVTKPDKDDVHVRQLIDLLHWLFTFPSSSSLPGLDLLAAAKKTGFDDQTFHKAQILLETLSDIASSSDRNQADLDQLMQILDRIDFAAQDIDSADQGASAMAAALEMIHREFAGVELSGSEIVFSPRLPAGWRKLVLNLRFRGTKFNVEISERLLILTADQDVTVKVYDQKADLKAGLLSTFALKK